VLGTHALPLFVVTALVLNAAPGANLARRLGARSAARRELNLLGATLVAAVAVRLAPAERRARA
jgi:hypothetical protein